MNWFGSARTNLFAVKDRDAFLKMVEEELPDVHVSEVQVSKGQGNKVWLYPDTYDGDFPSFCSDDEGEEVEIELSELIAPHLVEGEIVVVMCAGSEGSRYISGYALAFDHTGTEVWVNLSDIYQKAKEAFGAEPERAEY